MRLDAQVSPVGQGANPPAGDLESLRAQIERCDDEQRAQRAHIRALEQELALEREARQRVEAQVEDERAQLEEERRKLQDIRRENPESFFSSALLDAFHEVSVMAQGMS